MKALSEFLAFLLLLSLDVVFLFLEFFDSCLGGFRDGGFCYRGIK